MNSWNKCQEFPISKLWRGSRVPLLNFDRHPRSQDPEAPRPGVLVLFLHHASQILPNLRFKYYFFEIEITKSTWSLSIEFYEVSYQFESEIVAEKTTSILIA